MDVLEFGWQQDRENITVREFLEWVKSPATQLLAGKEIINEAKTRSIHFTDRMKLLAGNCLGLSSVKEFDLFVNGEWLTEDRPERLLNQRDNKGIENATPLPACYDSQIVVVTDSEEIIASDPITVNEYIRNWGPFDRYLRLRSEVE